MTLRDRVESRLKDLGLSPTEVSRKMGLKGNGSIWSLLSGRTKTFRNIGALAKALDTTPDWLLNGANIQSRYDKDSIKMIRQPGVDAVFGEDTVPILGHANGSPDAIMIDFDNELGQAPRHPNLKGIKDGFALYAAGDSMSPRYRPGELIYVAFNRPPLPGQDCVVELHNGEGYVKEFVKRTDKEIICNQHNPAQKWKRQLSDVKAVHAIVGRG